MELKPRKRLTIYRRPMFVSRTVREKLITEIMVSPAPTIRIAGEVWPIEVLRAQFARLTAAHVEAALWNLRKHSSEPITDAKAYMRALLYDALLTMNLRIAAEIRT